MIVTEATWKIFYDFSPTILNLGRVTLTEEICYINLQSASAPDQYKISLLLPIQNFVIW